jgi:hypothetical protein
MFEKNSRYSGVEDAITQAPDGRVLTYKRRWFLPKGREMPTLVEITVTQGERIDLIAARILGDPEQFWRICDANDAMNPFDLVSDARRVLRAAVPEGF